MNDEVEQAFRQGYIEGRTDSLKCDDMRIEHIATYYGFTSQADMLTEEAAEFTQAVNKLRRGFPDAYKNIKEEVADVLVVALQLRYLLGGDEIDKIMRDKTKRQIERIREEESNA